MFRYIITESRLTNLVANYIREELINSTSEYDDDGYVFYLSGKDHLFTIDDTVNQILIDQDFYHNIQRLFSLDRKTLDVIFKEVINEFLNGDYIHSFPYSNKTSE